MSVWKFLIHVFCTIVHVTLVLISNMLTRHKVWKTNHDSSLKVEMYQYLGKDNWALSFRTEQFPADFRTEYAYITWNRFPIKNCANWFDFVGFVETNYLNTDLYNFESSQSHESSQPADSSKAWIKLKPQLSFPRCSSVEYFLQNNTSNMWRHPNLP